MLPWLKSLDIDQHDLRVRYARNKINPLYIRIEGLKTEHSSRKGIVAIAHAICPYCRSDGKSLIESLRLFDSSEIQIRMLQSSTQKDFLTNVLKAVDACGKRGVAIDFDTLYKDLDDWQVTLKLWQTQAKSSKLL